MFNRAGTVSTVRVRLEIQSLTVSVVPLIKARGTP